MGSRRHTRRYDAARVQAELEGKNAYQGSPCKKNPDHIDEDGTTLRETIKYGCVQCTRAKEKRRNDVRRKQYSGKSKQQA